MTRDLHSIAQGHPAARRLTTVPGVGPIVALIVIALVDDPDRFRKTRDIGAWLGLTPRRYQFGEVDWSGRISKCGDTTLRALLCEAARSLIGQVRRVSTRTPTLIDQNP